MRAKNCISGFTIFTLMLGLAIVRAAAAQAPTRSPTATEQRVSLAPNGDHAASEARMAQTRQRVWFAPDNDTEDFTTLFQKPEAWANSRSRVQVFKFGPQQVRSTNQPPMNSYSELVKLDAFKKLRAWGIDVAIEAPSIKPWDCTAVKARQMTVDYIKNVKKANGLVKYIAMDEPLNSGLGKCNQSFDDVLDKTAAYIKELSADPELQALGTPVVVGDIEGWPWLNVDQIKRWIKGLEARGAKPAFFHLNSNIHRLDNDRKIDEQRDLRELQQFLRGEGIPFGVILWPGYNPVNSNQNYYERTIACTKRVHAAIGKPNDIVVQSWVTLGGNTTCSNTDPQDDLSWISICTGSYEASQSDDCSGR